jgi:hypothetical protein
VITAKQLEAQFRAELQRLLNIYNAELEAKDYYEGYPECGEDVRMSVSIPAVFDSQNNCVREAAEIDLGSCVLPVKHITTQQQGETK